MYRVFDSNNKSKEVNTLEEAYGVIKKYLEDNNFKSYYYNVNQIDYNEIRVDYGSHSHFFYIKNLDGLLSVHDKIE